MSSIFRKIRMPFSNQSESAKTDQKTQHDALHNDRRAECV